MKRILPLLMMTFLTSGNIFAGHFYNIEDESQLKSGSQLNQAHHMGFSDDTQATLISPRLAISVRHGTLGCKDQPHKAFMSFYGKRYEIVRAIEHPNVKSSNYKERLSSDLTLYVLSEDVTMPGGAPVACPLTQIDYTKALPNTDQPLYAHSLSQSPFIRLNNFHAKFKNVDFSSLYGKTRLSPHLYGDRFGNRSQIETVTHHDNSDPLLMVPVMGDSGSPLYMPLAGGGYTLIGAMARTGDVNEDPLHGVGQYTPMSNNIQWLRDKEELLIRDGTLPAYTKRFDVVTQTEWEQKDHTPAELIPAPRRSTPMGYLALNPDLVALWANLPFQEALAKAQWHLNNFAVVDSRRVYLSQGDGDLSLGTEDTANPAVYLALNPDLQTVFGTGTLQDALNNAKGHFYTSAKAELRRVCLDHTTHRPHVVTLPDTFFPETYLHLNPNLLTAPELAAMGRDAFAKWHYKNYGFKEKRDYLLKYTTENYPHRFMYFALNPDLRQLMTHESASNAFYIAQRHYRSLGFLEGRTYRYDGAPKIAPTGAAFTVPQDFDATLYLALNVDLYDHFYKESEYTIRYVDLLTKVEQHYVTVGGPVEGRRYR
ncbi:MAG: hypothetical protein ACK5YY_01620 [Alphaproteobacteria bacterium]